MKTHQGPWSKDESCKSQEQACRAGGDIAHGAQRLNPKIPSNARVKGQK